MFVAPASAGIGVIGRRLAGLINEPFPAEAGATNEGSGVHRKVYLRPTLPSRHSLPVNAFLTACALANALMLRRSAEGEKTQPDYQSSHGPTGHGALGTGHGPHDWTSILFFGIRLYKTWKNGCGTNSAKIFF